LEAAVGLLTATCHVAAEPAGVVLLLAEPASWLDPPYPDRRWVAGALRRDDSGFSAVVEVRDEAELVAAAVTTVVPGAVGGSDIRIVIEAADRWSARAVQRSAEMILASVAERARARAFAA
jgi:hypothetical protein